MFVESTESEILLPIYHSSYFMSYSFHFIRTIFIIVILLTHYCNHWRSHARIKNIFLSLATAICVSRSYSGIYFFVPLSVTMQQNKIHIRAYGHDAWAFPSQIQYIRLLFLLFFYQIKGEKTNNIHLICSGFDCNLQYWTNNFDIFLYSVEQWNYKMFRCKRNCSQLKKLDKLLKQVTLLEWILLKCSEFEYFDKWNEFIFSMQLP